MEKVILCKCPICGKDARTLDSRNEVEESFRRCDINETYRCYKAKDNENLRYVLRNKNKSDIDWQEVSRVERGVSTPLRNQQQLNQSKDA